MYKVFYVQNHNGAYYVSGKFRDTEGVDRYGTGCDAGIFSVKAKKRISKLLPDKAPNTASMLHIDPSGLVFYAGGRAFNVNNLEYTLPR